MNFRILSRSSILVLTAAFLLFGSIVYAATTRSGTSNINKFDYVEIDDGTDLAGIECITPFELGVYSDIPGMTKTFTQGGTNANEALVSFNMFLEHGDHPPVAVRLLIDDVVQPGTGSGITYALVNASESKNWTFVSAPLAPGTHTAKLQWKVAEVGDAYGNYMCIGDRNFIVQRR